MMTFVIVPNVLCIAINKKLDAALNRCQHTPSNDDREALYTNMLVYFNEHGVVPDIEIIKKDGA